MAEGHDLKADLVIAMQTMDASSFKSLLFSSSIDLSQVVDHSRSNIFHELALSSLTDSTEFDFLEIIIAYFYTKYAEFAKSRLRLLINTPNNTYSSTPLMLAVQRDKIVFSIQSLVKAFINLGAKIQCKNALNQTIAHLAAQCGYFHMLVFIKYELSVSMEEVDLNGHSPIALAVKEGKEAVVAVLIAWGSALASSDNEGNTLLHMAAEANNYKIAKLLLLRGTSRSVKNKAGLTALDLAEHKASTELIKILVIAKQKRPSIIANLNPCKPPLSPFRNSYKLFTLYVLIFILRYVCVIVFLLPHFAIELSLGSLTLFLISFVLFLAVHQKDPGFVRPNKGQNTAKLYLQTHSDYVCPFCEVCKGMDTYHCHHCDRCVEEYDHHCPWIRNCVGKNNFSLFFCFLTVCCIDFLYTSVLGLLDYFQLLQDRRRFFDYKTYHKEFGLFVTLLCFLCFAFALPIWILQVRNLLCKRDSGLRSRPRVKLTLNAAESLSSLIV